MFILYLQINNNSHQGQLLLKKYMTLNFCFLEPVPSLVLGFCGLRLSNYMRGLITRATVRQ